MSRSFNGTTDKLERSGTTNINSQLFSVSGFGNTASLTANTVVTALSRTNAPFVNDIALEEAGAVAGDPAGLLISDSGVNREFPNTSTSYSSGTWAVFSASNPTTSSHSIFLNGGGKGTSTVTVNPTIGTAVTQVGCRNEAGVDASFWNGNLAEVAWWSVALSDRQQAGIGKGACPLLVSMKVVAYWPLWPGNTGTETGLIRGTALTATGTASARHAPVFARHAGGA